MCQSLYKNTIKNIFFLSLSCSQVSGLQNKVYGGQIMVGIESSISFLVWLDNILISSVDLKKIIVVVMRLLSGVKVPSSISAIYTVEKTSSRRLPFNSIRMRWHARSAHINKM